MSTAIVRASKELKGSTSVIRQHLDAVDRAREVYLAQIKRAEVDYFDRIKRATEIIIGVADEQPATPNGQASPDQAVPAA
jgi:hypothetical protein